MYVNLYFTRENSCTLHVACGLARPPPFYTTAYYRENKKLANVLPSSQIMFVASNVEVGQGIRERVEMAENEFPYNLYPVLPNTPSKLG